MGRENYLKIVKKGGKVFIGLGIFICIVSIFMLLIFLVTDEAIQVAPVIAFSIMLGFGILLFVLGADYKKGENSRYIKKHPYVLELADSLVNPVFENDFIIISDKAISDKKNFRNIVALNNVLGIYEHIVRTNGIVTSHDIQLSSIDGREYRINVFARKRETKDDLVLTISNYCPNARVGYSPENLEYIEAKRKEYKNNTVSK